MNNDLNRLLGFLHGSTDIIKREFENVWNNLNKDRAENDRLVTIDVRVPLDIEPTTIILNFIGENKNTEAAIKLASVIKNNKVSRTCFGNNLYFRISDQGAQTWLLRYTRRGDRVEHKLGSYPEISLSDALDRAKEYKRLIKKGVYPAELAT